MLNFMDLSRQTAQIEEETLAAMRSVVRSNQFSGGTYVEIFEREFAAWLGTENFIGVNSGTDALLLAMRTLGIGPGDEVIVPANTFIATVWAPMYVGAKPVFADCDPETWEISVPDLKNRLTDQTAAVIGVHLYGQAFDVDAAAAAAAETGAFLVEDSAQAHGSLYKGKKAGTMGDIGCFSFYPGKNLGAYGEAGGLTVREDFSREKADRQTPREPSDEETDQRVGRSGKDFSREDYARSLRNQGSETRYSFSEMGYNLRMDGLQAAVLSAKLRHLDTWNARRREIVAAYRQEISNPRIRLQKEADYSEAAWHLAVCVVDEREKFLRHMEQAGIRCGIHYPIPCHLQKALREYGYREGDFPNAEYLAAHCVSLPLFAEMTEEDVAKVVDACNRYRG